jgi:NDP-sugar pyrophosphorylase family protein
VQRFFVNAGIYVLDPEALELIPKNEYFDMPTLFERLIHLECETAVFPIREYWLDIGRMDDFERANVEFMEVFG